MNIKKIAKNRVTFFLIMWISANYAQVGNVGGKTNSAIKKTNRDKIEAIEKACQIIIDGKSENNSSSSMSIAETSISSSDMNMLNVLGDITAQLQNHENLKEGKQLDTIQKFSNVYSKDKYAALILHNKEFIKRVELLSETLHKKGEGFEAALKTSKLEDPNIVLKKMAQVFHVMGSRLDSSIVDFRKTLPYLDEMYSKLLAVENETKLTANSQSNISESSNEQAELLKKMTSSIELTKNLNGVVLHLASIKKCIAVVSKTQEDLAFLAKVGRSLKEN